MRGLAAIALGLALGAHAAAAADSCVDCHRDLPEPLGTPVEGMKTDVHARAGLSCAGCHSGDPADEGESAMETEGFVGKPPPERIPGLCGSCHEDEGFMRRFNPQLPTDQVAQYRTSVHGQRLAEGDARVATCVSCHGVHGIVSVSDARSPVFPSNVAQTCARCHADASYMAGYRIPTDQLVEYQRSVHGHLLLVERDLSAPTCNDCHGNHGAYPPGADSVAAVCGQCHAINRDLFLASPHHAPFVRLGLAECVACHGNHEVRRTSDDMLGTSAVAVCVGCHAPDSAGFAAARRMRAAVDRLREALAAAEGTLGRAGAAGMEVSEAEFDLQEVREALVQARNQVHSFDPAALEKVASAGVEKATAAERVGEAALAEHTNRRWTALVPLAAIVLVAGLLYLKIRSLDEEAGPGSGSGGTPA
jgi:predicted CXXCH cytochrome family protein